MFCPYCGKQNSSQDLTCLSCGKVLPAPGMMPPAPARPAGGATQANPVVGGGSQSPAPLAAAPPLPRRSASAAATQYLDQNEARHQLEALRTGQGGGLIGRVKLVVEQGLILGEQFLLNDPDMMIGRYDAGSGRCPDIDLGAQDPAYVHRMHVRLRFTHQGEQLVVHDLGGRNGAYVNNRPLDRNGSAPLAVGDKLRVGRVVMRLLLAPEVEDHGRR